MTAITKSALTAVAALSADSIDDSTFASAASIVDTIEMAGRTSWANLARHAAVSETRMTLLCGLITDTESEAAQASRYAGARKAIQAASVRAGWIPAKRKDDAGRTVFVPREYDAATAAALDNQRSETAEATKAAKAQAEAAQASAANANAEAIAEACKLFGLDVPSDVPAREVLLSFARDASAQMSYSPESSAQAIAA